MRTLDSIKLCPDNPRISNIPKSLFPGIALQFSITLSSISTDASMNTSYILVVSILFSNFSKLCLHEWKNYLQTINENSAKFSEILILRNLISNVYNNSRNNKPRNYNILIFCKNIRLFKNV